MYHPEVVLHQRNLLYDVVGSGSPAYLRMSAEQRGVRFSTNFKT